MGALTEAEIFDCLGTNFRLAAETCELLATVPKKGPNYRKFREHLKLLEGACRQAAFWRQDARWLQLGLMMEHAHQVAGEWLRGVKQPDGSRRPIPFGEKHPLFMHLAEILRRGHIQAENYRTARTGRVGTILPKPAAHYRETKPVPVSGIDFTKRPSGLIVPANMRAQ